MKLIQVINIRKIFAERAQESLSIPLAYKIMRFMKASDKEGAFYHEQFQNILQKYAIKENGEIKNTPQGGVKIIPSAREEFKEAVKNLDEQEIETPNIDFSINELNELKFSVAELYSLDELIKEG